MSKDIIALLIVTLITVIAWIGFEVYHRSTTIYIGEEILQQATPIDTDLDLEFITNLNSYEKP